MTLETFPFDAADQIRSREDAAIYMDLVLADGDAAEIVDALDVIARGLGQPEPGLPSHAGLERIASALSALGLRLGANTVAAAEAEAA